MLKMFRESDIESYKLLFFLIQDSTHTSNCLIQELLPLIISFPLIFFININFMLFISHFHNIFFTEGVVLIHFRFLRSSSDSMSIEMSFYYFFLFTIVVGFISRIFNVVSFTSIIHYSFHFHKSKCEWIEDWNERVWIEIESSLVWLSLSYSCARGEWDLYICVFNLLNFEFRVVICMNIELFLIQSSFWDYYEKKKIQFV